MFNKFKYYGENIIEQITILGDRPKDIKYNISNILITIN